MVELMGHRKVESMVDMLAEKMEKKKAELTAVLLVEVKDVMKVYTQVVLKDY
jgi:hypothetical protein